MRKIELNEEEAATLKDILNSYVSDLRMEVADTDSKDLRDELKQEEKFILDLIRKIS